MGKIRITTIVFGLAGLAVLAWLLARAGIGNILAVMSLVGLNIFWLGVYRIVPIGLDAFGWRQLFAEKKSPSFADLIKARWIAEAVNTLFPVAQVGGHILRARIIGKKSGAGNEAGATVMVDFTIGLSTQILFTILGLFLLLLQTKNHSDTSAIIIGIGVAMIVIGGFFFSQKAGLFGFLARRTSLLLHKKKSNALVNGARNLDQKITEIYSHRNKLLLCLFWRLVGWIAKSGENWLFFFFLGTPITLQEAVILESMCTAFRSAAFFVPGGLGVQDGSLLVIGSLLGLGPDNIMALALGKRFRELIVGLPGLSWWFILEGRYHKRPISGKEA
ncbi:MAG TPA: flippase-like domain-containing protein [Desulfobulbaceae bacterium]|nr:flippase-like domain-containing protein [Desulfobulbaceae bacterium]